MSSSHRKDMVTHPNYNDKKWHGNYTDIIAKVEKSLNTSYNRVDAQRLEDDHIFELVDHDKYRRRARRIIEDMLKNKKKGVR